MDSRKIDNKKMMALGDELKSKIPGCGFALIAFDIIDGVSHGNYISNVNDEYMIKALEFQLAVLKRKTQ